MDIKTFMGRLDSYIKEYPLEAEKAMRKEANHHLLVKVENAKFPRVGKWQSMVIVAVR